MYDYEEKDIKYVIKHKKKSLYFGQGNDVSSDDLTKYIDDLQHVTFLYIEILYHGFPEALYGLKNIKKLEIVRYAYDMVDFGRFDKLESLSVTHKWDSNGMMSDITGLSLRKLSIYKPNLEQTMNMIYQMKNLESLGISFWNTPIPERFKTLTNLKSINICANEMTDVLPDSITKYSVTDTVFNDIKFNKNTTSIKVSYHDGNSLVFDHIYKLHKLERLDVFDEYASKDQYSQLNVGCLPNLKRSSINYCTIIGNFPNLTVLCLTNCKCDLSTLPVSLKSLSISNMNCELLSGDLINLEELYLNDCKCVDLENIIQYKIKRLAIYYCHNIVFPTKFYELDLEYLDISNSYGDDAKSPLEFNMKIGHFPNLRKLKATCELPPIYQKDIKLKIEKLDQLTSKITTQKIRKMSRILVGKEKEVNRKNAIRYTKDMFDPSRQKTKRVKKSQDKQVNVA